MPVDLTKLLPSNLKSTRWYDIIDVFQDYLYNTIQPELFDRLKTKWILDEMTEDDIRNLAYMFGSEIGSGSGYISTLSYLKKVIYTQVPRIKYKNSLKGYDYIFYIYLLLGEVYPLLLNNSLTLDPWLDWETYPEIGDDFLTLDQGLLLDQEMDNILYYAGPGPTNPVYGTPINEGLPAWTLDQTDLSNIMTRHFLLSYYPRFVENSTQFISENTNRAFFNHVFEMKKATEIPHFQFNFNLYANSDGSTRLTNYTTEEDRSTVLASQESVLIGTDLSDIAKIKFGDGGHAVVDATITDIDSLLYEYTLPGDWNVYQTLDKYYMRNSIDVDSKWYDFSEVAVFDSGNNIVYYSKFPTISFYFKMYSCIYLYFNIV